MRIGLMINELERGIGSAMMGCDVYVLFSGGLVSLSSPLPISLS